MLSWEDPSGLRCCLYCYLLLLLFSQHFRKLINSSESTMFLRNQCREELGRKKALKQLQTYLQSKNGQELLYALLNYTFTFVRNYFSALPQRSCLTVLGSSFRHFQKHFQFQVYGNNSSDVTFKSKQTYQNIAKVSWLLTVLKQWRAVYTFEVHC